MGEGDALRIALSHTHGYTQYVLADIKQSHMPRTQVVGRLEAGRPSMPGLAETLKRHPTRGCL